jgi:N6-L-threonylcarbamoyladenine synthase
LAAEGDPAAFDFPRPMLKEQGDDFSFSGLKTAVRYFVRDHPECLTDRRRVSDLCASVQAAIVDVLVTKTIRAAQRLGVSCVTASGGVTCNRVLRSELRKACDRAGWTLRLAEPTFCTDNAGMIGVLAEWKLSQGVAPTALDAEVIPGWELA